MATIRISLDDTLRAEYDELFETCKVNNVQLGMVDRVIEKLVANRQRYDDVSSKLGGQVPWFFIAVIHNMEASCSFTKHLHNGDPLTARTTHVPKGYPQTGNPPFAWEASAADALTLKGLQNWSDWSVSGMLFKLEEYNGWGYRRYHPTVKSPYLWSGSNKYTKGKYVADGRFDPEAVSKQIGVATIMKRMQDQGLISL